MKKIITYTLVALASSPFIAFALPQDAPIRLGDNDLTSGALSVYRILQIIANWIFTILLILAVIFILIAAFHYLTAAGDETKIKKAHSILIWSVVAVAVAFLAKGLIFLVKELVAPGAPGPTPGQL